jgi:hypothetical protein
VTAGSIRGMLEYIDNSHYKPTRFEQMHLPATFNNNYLSVLLIHVIKLKHLYMHVCLSWRYLIVSPVYLSPAWHHYNM